LTFIPGSLPKYPWYWELLLLLGLGLLLQGLQADFEMGLELLLQGL